MVVKFTVEVALQPKDSTVLESMCFVKTRELPLVSSRPMSGQLQIITTPIDPVDTMASNAIFFMSLHQATRHLYSPLAYSAAVQMVCFVLR